MSVEMVEDHPLRELRGVIELGGKPVSALVEVFPEVKSASPNRDDSQRRVAACRTKSDGQFCFKKLAAGRYQLRCSMDAGIDVTLVDVVVDQAKGKNKKIKAVMQVGT